MCSNFSRHGQSSIGSVVGLRHAPESHPKIKTNRMQYSLSKDHSASQMTVAKVMDIMSRLPGCAGQAADAVSAYTQVKMKDAPTFLKIPKSECPEIGIRLPKHKWPKSGSSMEDPVVPLERNLYGHPLTGLLWERQCENVLLKIRLGKSSKLGMFIRYPKKEGLSLSVYRWEGMVATEDTKFIGNADGFVESVQLSTGWLQLAQDVGNGDSSSILNSPTSTLSLR